MSEVLSVKNLCKTYIVNKIQNNVLRNVDFSLNNGEFVSVMGPSGSGKSTLLYTVSGMDFATEGQIVFNGNELTKYKANQLSDVRLNEMGFIFQQMHMLRNLSVYDNIIVSAYNSKNGKTHKQREEINSYAKELMRKFEIIDIADNDITEVSGGQLQRACICRALINKPKVIFADEPTGALNSKAAKEVMEELIRINGEGTSILLVTHDIKVAAKTDKVIYIMDGDIQGELTLGKYNDGCDIRERESNLTNWLMDMGW